MVQVTCLFYLIDAATNDVVEGGKVDQQRPPWLGMSFYLSCFSLQQQFSSSLMLLGHARMQGCQCTS